MRPAFYVLRLLPAVALSACGQTGPLYLPDEGVETPVEVRGAATPAPETENENEDEDGDRPQER